MTYILMTIWIGGLSAILSDDFINGSRQRDLITDIGFLISAVGWPLLVVRRLL